MNQALSKLTIITVGLLFALSANAVAINEYFIEENTGEFTVTNDTDQDIYLFAVGNNDASYAEYSPAIDGVDLGWDGVVLNEEAWNAGYNIYIGRDIYVNTSTLGSLSVLGSFGSLFGDYTSAILFFVSPERSPEVNDPIAAGMTASGFTFYTGELASPFAVFGDFGNLIEQGNTVHGAAVVPVPAAAWLFGSGLIGLVGLARRKQS